MTNSFDHEDSPKDEAKADPVLRDVDPDQRSDANDGIKRPLGYYSSQAQADRSLGSEGATPTNEAASGPGFYSPEQQASRNASSAEGAAHKETDENTTQTNNYAGYHDLEAENISASKPRRDNGKE